MGLFNRKDKKSEEVFNATQSFMVDALQYDEEHNLIKIKNGFKSNVIPVSSIDSVRIGFNGKIYSETDIKTTINGILAGTYKSEIHNIQIRIESNKKFYFIILSVGKMLPDKAERLLTAACEMTTFINSIK